VPRAGSPPYPAAGGGEGAGESLWQATTEAARQTVRKVKQLGRGVGMALVAAGGVVAGIVYAARAQIAAAAVAVYDVGKRIIGKAATALARLLPVCVFGVT
jgi:hypothetical protein